MGLGDSLLWVLDPIAANPNRISVDRVHLLARKTRLGTNGHNQPLAFIGLRSQGRHGAQRAFDASCDMPSILRKKLP